MHQEGQRNKIRLIEMQKTKYMERNTEQLELLDEQNKDFLFQSKEEYGIYERTGNLNRFRQASNKLFALTENIVERDTGKWFATFTDFATNFKKGNSVKFRTRGEMLDFLTKLKALHSFYYHGIEEATDKEALENTYKEVYAKLEEVV